MTMLFFRKKIPIDDIGRFLAFCVVGPEIPEDLITELKKAGFFISKIEKVFFELKYLRVYIIAFKVVEILGKNKTTDQILISFYGTLKNENIIIPEIYLEKSAHYSKALDEANADTSLYTKNICQKFSEFCGYREHYLLAQITSWEIENINNYGSSPKRVGKNEV